MKKIIVLMLAVVMTFTFCACDNGEEDARLAAEGFLNAYVNVDFAEIANYVDDASKLPDEIKDFDIENITQNAIPEDFKQYSEEFQGIIDVLLAKFKENMAYTINSVEKVDDKFKFTTSMTSPNFDIDMEKVLSEKINEDQIAKVITDLYTSGVISDSSTEEEIIDAAIEPLFSIIKDTIKETDFGKETTECEIIVKNIDGSWLVSTEDSSFDF